MNKPALLISLSLAFLASCNQMASQSGLYHVPLKHEYKLGVDGIWFWNKGNPYPDASLLRIYVAPLNVDLVKEKNPETADQLVPQMQNYMRQYLTQALDENNRINRSKWELTDDPAKADIRIDLAVVRLRPQRPGLRILAQVGGFFSPIPGISGRAESFAKGDICLEGAIRKTKDNELLMAFKDSNRKTTRIYTAEAFSRMGQADVNLRQWAKNLARMMREGAQDKSHGRTIQQRLQQESFGHAIQRRASSAIDY